MMPFRYSLMGDGAFDAVLLHPIDWLLRELAVPSFSGEWAELSFLRQPPETLETRVQAVLHYFPCDVLFIHRDAERGTLEERRREIKEVVGNLANSCPVVCVVPVRMTEAWFLHDERAIREAAGNPNGRKSISLPRIDRLESLPDPKRELSSLLVKATEATGRRQTKRKQDLPKMRRRVAESIDDFEPLRELPAFQAFEQDLRRTISSIDSAS